MPDNIPLPVKFNRVLCDGRSASMFDEIISINPNDPIYCSKCGKTLRVEKHGNKTDTICPKHGILWTITYVYGVQDESQE